MNAESLENRFCMLVFCLSPSPYLSLHIIYFVPRSAVQTQPYVATRSCCCTMAWNHAGKLSSVPDLKRTRNKKQKCTIALPSVSSVCFLSQAWARAGRGDGRRWRPLVPAQKLSGPVLTLKLRQRNESVDDERADAPQADGLEHRPPRPRIVFPQKRKEVPTSLEPAAEAKRPIIGSSHISHPLFTGLCQALFWSKYDFELLFIHVYEVTEGLYNILSLIRIVI